MQLKIDRIILHNFKGITHENLLFNNSNVIVSGANGSGKSTIACAWFWLMSDTDEKLSSNPPVFPLNVEECTPSVEVVASVDGKQITLERKVKRTVKKSKTEGMNDSVSFSSTYLVNSVEFGLRDFKAKLAEYGITDKFLTLSHPDMFLSGKKDEMRKVLFSMADDKSDYEIALMDSNTLVAAKYLKDYKFDEVSAMSKATLRKISEVYGKDGELLRAKIEGLEMSKADMDFAELELQKNGLHERLEKNQDAQRVGNLIDEELNKLREQDMKLQFELSGIRQKEQAEKDELERKIRQNRREVEEKANVLDRDIKRYKNEVQIYDDAFRRGEAEKKALEEKLEIAKARTLNESKCICPVCNRPYEQHKIAEIRASFEDDKASEIAGLEKKIAENESLTAIKHAELDEIKRKLEQAIKDRAEVENVLNQPLDALDTVMEEPNTYGEEKARLTAELENIAKQIEIKKADMPNMLSLKAEEAALNQELRDCEIQLGKADLNAEIDNKIEALREQQTEFEQNKADAEKVLYQLSLVQKRKYDLLTESINAHFKLIKWCFWEYQKNGEPKDVVIPKVDGKALGSDLNTAMCVLAKLDIIQGLQNYYGESYPVFVDGAESLDDNSMAQIDMPCQMVYLKVADNTKMFVKEI